MPWRPLVSRTSADLLLRWSTLRQETAHKSPAHVAASELHVSTGYGTAKLSTTAAGLPQLLLPVPSGTRRPSFEDLVMLEVGAGVLSDASGSGAYLIITCLEPALERAFADLVLAVLSRIETGEPALDALKDTVVELRALFGDHPDLEVSDECIRGLAAELIVLRDLTHRSPRAPEIWFGPNRDRHDFRGGVHAIEVKSSLRVTSRVTISSLDQLSTPEDGTLELWRVVVERTVNGPISISRLVADIEAASVATPILRKRLAEMGCPDPTSPAWNSASFNQVCVEGYAVSDGFPRITPGSFTGATAPAGIGAVRYEVDLGQAEPWRLTDQQMQASSDRILACLS